MWRLGADRIGDGVDQTGGGPWTTSPLPLLASPLPSRRGEGERDHSRVRRRRVGGCALHHSGGLDGGVGVVAIEIGGGVVPVGHKIDLVEPQVDPGQGPPGEGERDGRKRESPKNT